MECMRCELLTTLAGGGSRALFLAEHPVFVQILSRDGGDSAVIVSVGELTGFDLGMMAELAGQGTNRAGAADVRGMDFVVERRDQSGMV